MKYDTLQNLIKTSRFLVCLEGIHISEDCGCMNYRDEANAYNIEEKYSCSPEEIFNAAFLTHALTNSTLFFRNEMLSSLGAPDDCIKVLQKWSLTAFSGVSLPVNFTPWRKEPDAGM